MKSCTVLFVICAAMVLTTATASADLVITSARYVHPAEKMRQYEIARMATVRERIEEKKVQLRREIKHLERKIAERTTAVPQEVSREERIEHLRNEIEIVKEKIAYLKAKKRTPSSERVQKVKKNRLMAPQLNEIAEPVSENPPSIQKMDEKRPEDISARHEKITEEKGEERRKILFEIRRKVKHLEVEIALLKKRQTELEVQQDRNIAAYSRRMDVPKATEKVYLTPREKHERSGMVKDSTAVIIIVILTLLGIFTSLLWRKRKKDEQSDQWKI